MLIRIPQTLWDLLPKRRRAQVEAQNEAAPLAPRPKAPPRASKSATRKGISGPAPARNGVQDKYDEMTRRLLALHGVRVRRWRTAMSGIAWEVRYHDGRVSRLIEAPKPKGPMSAAVFLHEIGHHAIGFNRYKPRCLEEYHAWAWAVEEMERQGLNVTDRVHNRMRESLQYAVRKATRRGIKELPPELHAYV